MKHVLSILGEWFLMDVAPWILTLAWLLGWPGLGIWLFHNHQGWTWKVGGFAVIVAWAGTVAFALYALMAEEVWWRRTHSGRSLWFGGGRQ
mgnify:CR=1 FL=1